MPNLQHTHTTSTRWGRAGPSAIIAAIVGRNKSANTALYQWQSRKHRTCFASPADVQGFAGAAAPPLRAFGHRRSAEDWWLLAGGSSSQCVLPPTSRVLTPPVVPQRRCMATTLCHKLMAAEDVEMIKHSSDSQIRPLQVQNALSRKNKEAAVEKLTAAFEESTVVFGLRIKGISVSCHFL